MALASYRGRLEMEANYTGQELQQRTLVAQQAALNDEIKQSLSLLFKFNCNPCCQAAAAAIADTYLATVVGVFTLGASLAIPTNALESLLAGVGATLQSNIDFIIFASIMWTLQNEEAPLINYIPIYKSYSNL